MKFQNLFSGKNKKNISKCHMLKSSTAGCGRHIEIVLDGIPEEERCSCRKDKSKCTIL